MSNPARQQILEEASEFVARAMSGDATDDDVRALDHWLAQNDRHAHEYQAMLETWGAADVAKLEFIGAESESGKQGRLGVWNWPVSGGVSLLSWKWAAGVAACVVLLAGVYVSQMSTGVDDPNALARYETTVGARQEIVLADGSIVSLNTDSRIIVDYSSESRKIILDRGEAFFDVEKDKDRPFTVVAGANYITAIGTEFGVRRIGDEVKVSVVEGAVAVNNSLEKDLLLSGAAETIANHVDASSQSSALLSAGAVASYWNGAMRTERTSELKPEKINSWRNGYIRFDEAPLEAVTTEIDRYLPEAITFRDEEARQHLTSAIVRLDDIDGLWQGLEQALPIKVYRYSDNIVIASKS